MPLVRTLRAVAIDVLIDLALHEHALRTGAKEKNRHGS